MRGLISILSCVILAGSTALATDRAPQEVCRHASLTNSLLAWFAFDGNVNDAQEKVSAKIANGALEFGPDRTGNPRGALQASGSTALSADGINISNGSFTLQFWALNPTNWFLGQGMRRDYQGLHIGVDASGMRCDYWGNSLSASLGSGPGWGHWIIRHDGLAGRRTIWRDGQCVAESTNSPYTGTGPFVVGRHFSGGGFFTGRLDDFAVWNRSLSDAEIADLYSVGRGMVFKSR